MLRLSLLKNITLAKIWTKFELLSEIDGECETGDTLLRMNKFLDILDILKQNGQIAVPQRH